MIPEFADNGYLPPGIHLATLNEAIQRFGVGSELRRIQGESLEWLVPLCRHAGIARLIVNGSFVTDVAEPGDVDCVLLQGPRYDERSAEAELERGLPYLSLDIVRQDAFNYLVERFFASDREGVAKGVLEIVL